MDDPPDGLRYNEQAVFGAREGLLLANALHEGSAAASGQSLETGTLKTEQNANTSIAVVSRELSY